MSAAAAGGSQRNGSSLRDRNMKKTATGTSPGLAFARRKTKEETTRSTRSSGRSVARASPSAADEALFEQHGGEFPEGVVAAGDQHRRREVLPRLGSAERESIVRQLVRRVVDTIARWGREGRYFRSDADACAWRRADVPSTTDLPVRERRHVKTAVQHGTTTAF